jgi:2,4-dienoyl-CoA reductase-like NADH-dependent reductase (Old Yellow Enzyme family)/thioredoxin reductase
MEHFRSLFTPGRIGTLDVKNRILMAPMVRNYADQSGRATPKYIAHIERVARGGVGTMILEASYVRADGKGFTNELGLHDDGVIPGLKALVDAAHSHGAMIGPQIIHAGRQTSSQVTGVQPIAPSAIPDPSTGEIPCELTIREIGDIVQAFAQAAKRCKDAGCDLVEIHGAHGYLITQFLSPFSNKRVDRYGGSFENRMRFLAEIVDAVSQVVGSDFPITVRLSADEMVPDGLTPDDTARIALRLEELGVDALSISAGNYASYELGYMIPPMAIPDGPLLSYAQQIKEEVTIPVIAVGKIRTPQLAAETLNSGKADFIALGRPFLADPDWPIKTQEGRVDEINKCIACNQGCISRLFVQNDVWCTVNPETSRELEFEKPVSEAKMNVFIAGGGPAGMEAAKIAAERGRHVVLCEATDHLGGQLIPASTAPYRPGWAELRDYLVREMDRLGIDLRMSTEASPDLAREVGADLAIVAIGSRPYRPDIPGIDRSNVVTARDILEGNATVTGKVIMAGGGCSGAQTAEYLATRGHQVTIVDVLGAIAIDAPSGERELLLGRLERLGVQFLIDTRILSIEENRVGVENPQGLAYLPADTVVICLGSIPNNSLAGYLRSVVPEVLTVGDAIEPRKVTEAMLDGALAGLSLQTASRRFAA